jgi:glycyl-tRNA synthetase
MPAHDYVLKCSHTFNLLDSRGAIGVTERANYFRRMRDLSRSVATAYVAQRQVMEYPWLKESDQSAVISGQPTASRQQPTTSIKEPASCGFYI